MATTSTSSESDALISMATSDTKTSTSAGGGGNMRKQSNQSSSGATKRGKESSSMGICKGLILRKDWKGTDVKCSKMIEFHGCWSKEETRGINERKSSMWKSFLLIFI